jgi:hypothetical protein
MPMIVDPNAPEIEVPEEVWSSDGYLVAILDAPYAGVLLVMDRPSYADPITHWTVERVNPDGSRHLVRSGDPVWAPGGMGLCYDHEAPLGVAVLYSATPLDADGIAVASPSTVAVTIPVPAFPRDVWIKSTDRPSASLRVHVEDWPELATESRNQLVVIPGDRYPAATLDVYDASTSTMTLFTETTSEAVALRDLLESPDVLLVSARPEHNRTDEFVVTGALTEAIIGPGDPARRWTVPLQPVARPATRDQVMRMPGWSCDELLERFATLSAVAASYPTNAAAATDGLA